MACSEGTTLTWSCQHCALWAEIMGTLDSSLGSGGGGCSLITMYLHGAEWFLRTL